MASACYTIGLGGDQDAALLGAVAVTTGASYFPISAGLSAAQAEAAITAALVQIAGESRENGGVVAFDEIDGAGRPIDDGAPFFGPVGESFGETGERSLRFPVTISEGSTHATLGAMWRDRQAGHPGPDLRSRRRPRSRRTSGARGRADRTPSCVLRGRSACAGHLGGRGARITSRRSGPAQHRLRGQQRRSTGGERCSAPSRRGATFRMRARLLSPHPVPDADITARIYSPPAPGRRCS